MTVSTPRQKSPWLHRHGSIEGEELKAAVTRWKENLHGYIAMAPLKDAGRDVRRDDPTPSPWLHRHGSIEGMAGGKRQAGVRQISMATSPWLH